MTINSDKAVTLELLLDSGVITAVTDEILRLKPYVSTRCKDIIESIGKTEVTPIT